MAEVPEEPDVEYAPELPQGVLVKIFSGLLPRNPDCLRDLCAAASVCPSWREAAKKPCLWRVLYVLNAPLNARLTGPRLRNLVARSHNTLTRLELVGCPLVSEAALTLSLQQQPRLVFVRVKDCALVTRPGLAHALCDAEDFQGVVAQLNDPRQSVADAQRCCLALCSLIYAMTPEDAVALAEAQAAGVLSALLHCVNKHTAHAGVQAACCWALGHYVNVARLTAVHSYPPVFQALVAALKAHPLDTNVQRSALSALSNVCSSGLEGTPGVPALLDAIQHVLAALRAFPTDLIVQEFGCDSLERMCDMDASVAEAVAAAGAMGLFIKALRLDTADDAECMSAMNAIKAIALAPAALPQASAGIDAVMRALRLLQEHSNVVNVACQTLMTYLQCPATRERAFEAGANGWVARLVGWLGSLDLRAGHIASTPGATRCCRGTYGALGP